MLMFMRAFLVALIFVWFSAPAVAQVEYFNSIPFTKADSVARLYPNHSLDNLKALSDKLTTPFVNDVEKFRAIYTWVCLNIKNDYELFQKNQQKRKKLQGDSVALKAWNKEFSASVFKELRKRKSTVCTGYAYLIRELANFARIECVIVDGYGRTAMANVEGTGEINHSWNAVFLHATWYVCDATWSSGAIDMELKEFIPNYNDVYFLQEPTQFVRNHYPINQSYTLLPWRYTLQEFLSSPLIYVSFFDYNFTKILPKTFEINTVRKQPVNIVLKGSKQPIQKVELQIKGSGQPRLLKPKYTLTGDTLSINHTFTTKGTYVVHVVLDGKIVVTYRVVVSNF